MPEAAELSGFSLDQTRRLRDKAAFDRVFAGASRSRDRCFTILYRKNGRRQARLGMAIAKKNCRLAVARNRLKRIIRESFRTQQARLSGLDIIVMNKRGAEQLSSQQLFESLAAHWQRCQGAPTSGQEKTPNG